MNQATTGYIGTIRTRLAMTRRNTKGKSKGKNQNAK